MAKEWLQASLNTGMLDTVGVKGPFPTTHLPEAQIRVRSADKVIGERSKGKFRTRAERRLEVNLPSSYIMSDGSIRGIEPEQEFILPESTDELFVRKRSIFPYPKKIMNWLLSPIGGHEGAVNHVLGDPIKSANKDIAEGARSIRHAFIKAVEDILEPPSPANYGLQSALRFAEISGVSKLGPLAVLFPGLDAVLVDIPNIAGALKRHQYKEAFMQGLLVAGDLIPPAIAFALTFYLPGINALVPWGVGVFFNYLTNYSYFDPYMKKNNYVYGQRVLHSVDQQVSDPSKKDASASIETLGEFLNQARKGKRLKAKVRDTIISTVQTYAQQMPKYIREERRLRDRASRTSKPGKLQEIYDKHLKLIMNKREAEDYLHNLYRVYNLIRRVEGKMDIPTFRSFILDRDMITPTGIDPEKARNKARTLGLESYLDEEIIYMASVFLHVDFSTIPQHKDQA